MVIKIKDFTMTKGKGGILNITYNSSIKPKVSDNLDLVILSKTKDEIQFFGISQDTKNIIVNANEIVYIETTNRSGGAPIFVFK
ncbi:hypothetical protein NDJ00_24230 [Vibrio parahaemolyticus]|uniref:hypothetical protein n=2 Tax=Vibrionaceae TaxID=641 RepID=UPI0006A5DAF0|nr:hypothetical protein ACX13_21885 [Vibrio parahaemolyticus]MCS0117292.1 hypothetical protein [Vibrio parahaemolyticus]